MATPALIGTKVVTSFTTSSGGPLSQPLLKEKNDDDYY
jgi:hypothetical protein